MIQLCLHPSDLTTFRSQIPIRGRVSVFYSKVQYSGLSGSKNHGPVLPGFPLGTPPSPPRFAWRWPRILLKSGLPLKVGCPPFPFRHLSNLGPPPVKKNRALLVTTSTSARQFLSQFPFSCFFPLQAERLDFSFLSSLPIRVTF